jgi:hypothetical protein
VTGLTEPRDPRHGDFAIRLAELVPVYVGAGPYANVELLAVIDALMQHVLAALYPLHPSQSTEAAAAITRATHAWRDAVEDWTYLSAHPCTRKSTTT